MNSLKKIGVSGGAWLFSSSILKYLLSILSLMVLARQLTPKDFGIVSAAIVVISFVNIFTEIGMGPALVQKKEITSADKNTAFTMSLLLGFFAIISIILLSDNISAFFGIDELSKVLPVFCFIIVVNAISLVSKSLIQRELKFKIIAKIELISYFVGYFLVAIPLTLITASYWGLVIGGLVHALANGFLYIFFNKNRFHLEFSLKSLKELVHFSTGHTVGRLGSSVALQGDNLIVGRALGAEALGLYSRAYQLITFPVGLIGGVLEKVLFPLMSSIQEDDKRLGNIYSSCVSLISFVSIPISAILFVFAPEIVLLVLGSQWANLVAPFQALTSILVFRIAYKVSVSICNAKGAVFRKALVQWLYAFSILIFSLVGTKFGVLGVATGVAIAVFINYALMFILTCRVIKFNYIEIVTRQVKICIITFLTVLLVKYVGILVPDSDFYLFKSILMLFVFGVTFLLILFFSRKHFKFEISYILSILYSIKR